ncbi:MAG TPA: type II toxin-antitoxin system RelE/ParE family toxin [Candidatus Absconditabacterales bacterium]|nr:type II toxin-antitoxin system RelE/ParE family toxin [Candidatus Absconditabacterales bacterium]
MVEQRKKDLEKISKTGRDEILKIACLIRDGRTVGLDIKKIQGKQNLYRCRYGKYRIIFSILGNKIQVIRVGNRGNIYKGL